MTRLFVLIEILLEVLASWTLAYHFALLVHLPAGLTILPFLIALITMVALSLPSWRRAFRRPIGSIWFLIGIGMCSLTAGTLTIFTSRPNNDDMSLFHRALVQVTHLNGRFIITDTSHNLPGLPALSALHVMTSYEPGVALAAAAVGADPLWVYQNVSGFIAGALLPVVYVLLYRRFRLSKLVALGSTAIALGFLLIDGNLQRSFGNVALVRLWQGKTILWTLFIPLTLLIALRFLNRPSIRRFTMVMMAAVCAVGLSNSAVFLIPVLLFGISVAYLFGYGFARTRVPRAIMLNLASFYCVGIAAALVLGIIPRPIDTTAWATGWPFVWWENLGLVIGDRTSLVRDMVILTALPLAALPRPLARFPALLTLALCLTFANPLLGPRWMQTIQPASYWRLIYLFPLPWCVGLIVSALACAITRHKARLARASIAAAAVLAVLAAYHTSTLSEENGTMFKAAGEYKFRPADLQFARLVAWRLGGRNLLASEDMIVVLALLNPSIRLEAGRRQETLHIFRSIKQAQEGARRVAAQNLVTTGVRSPDNDTAFLGSLHNGVDAMILRPCYVPAVSELIASESGRWEEAERNQDYVLLLRQE